MAFIKFIAFIIICLSVLPSAMAYQYISGHNKSIKKVVLLANYFYTIKKGDSLNSIAKRFSLTVKKLKRINRISENYVRAGDSIIIRIPKQKNIYVRIKNVNSSILAYKNSYTVKKGDSLYLISKRFSANVSELKKYNHIGNKPLQIGRKLIVPSRTNPLISYRMMSVAGIVVNTRRKLVKYNLLIRSKSLRYRIVKIAERYLGSPYKFGGESFKKGIDCSAFVMRIFRKVHIRLPRTTWTQYRYGRVIPKSSLRDGDLVFFNTHRGPHTHVGIYIGNNKFIQASSGRVHAVTISRLTGLYKRIFDHAVRVIKR